MRHKIVVLGDGGVGKTALTIQLCMNHFVETYDPTIEDSYMKQVVIDEIPCQLEILDTAGQEEYTALRDQWIRDGEGFVLVYSITARETFYRIERFLQRIQRVKDTDDHVPIILVGNKCDLNAEREVSVEEGQKLAIKLRCEFLETSAKYRVNVERAFYHVVRALRKEQEYQTQVRTSKTLKRSEINVPLHKTPRNHSTRGQGGHNKDEKCVLM
ncbi:ras family-domain-containing protein [Obelidium mucronatum]|nr:ras family-domain-containing protein [Obelidium mucronatum]